jgi:uncharacterized protein YwqG
MKLEANPELDETLANLREPAIWLTRAGTGDVAGKLGGLPNLPSIDLWPRHGRTDLPLHFLAQVNLAKLPVTPLAGAKRPYKLPRRGMLFFFADVEEEMLWEDSAGTPNSTRVVFAHSIGPQANVPSNLPLINHTYGEHGGTYASDVRVYPEASLHAYVIDTFAGVDFEGPATTREAHVRTLLSAERALGSAVPRFSTDGGWEEFFTSPIGILEYKDSRRDLRLTRHQMLGAATSVQGTADGMRERGIVPLLQIDSDQGLHKHFMFCDMGMAQFWIESDDLAVGRFERAWGTTEGG